MHPVAARTAVRDHHRARTGRQGTDVALPMNVKELFVSREIIPLVDTPLGAAVAQEVLSRSQHVRIVEVLITTEAPLKDLVC